MEFFVTKIVDHPVAFKIDLKKISELLVAMEQPKSFRDVRKWIIAFVAREPNDFEFDAWKENGKIYLTIPLVYEQVLEETEEEITRRCCELFGRYINSLQTGAQE